MNTADAYIFFIVNGYDPRSLSTKEIRAAWRNLSKRLHDQTGGRTRIITALNVAFEKVQEAKNLGLPTDLRNWEARHGSREEIFSGPDFVQDLDAFSRRILSEDGPDSPVSSAAADGPQGRVGPDDDTWGGPLGLTPEMSSEEKFAQVCAEWDRRNPPKPQINYGELGDVPHPSDMFFRGAGLFLISLMIVIVMPFLLGAFFGFMKVLGFTIGFVALLWPLFLVMTVVGAARWATAELESQS